MAINLLTQVNSQGASAANGGCWALFGCRTPGSGGWSSPCDLIVNGVQVTLTTLQQIGNNDNPSVDFVDCDLEYLFLYGCGGFMPCSCPPGECSRFRNYIFDANGCCCTLPCSGSYKSCLFPCDTTPTVSPVTVGDMELNSVIINGVEQVTTAIPFSYSPNITIGGILYNPSTVNSINAALASIGVSDIMAELPLASDNGSICTNELENLFRMKGPDCIPWEISFTVPRLTTFPATINVKSNGTATINGNTLIGGCSTNGDVLYLSRDNIGIAWPVNCTPISEC